MGINNIDDLKGNASVDASEPTVPPTESNTQAGVPTPIDNVAQEKSSDVGQAPEDAGDSDE